MKGGKWAALTKLPYKPTWVYISNFHLEDKSNKEMLLSYKRRGVIYDLREPQATPSTSVEVLKTMGYQSLYLFQ